MSAAFQHEKLWESFKKGDKAAFADIYDKHIYVLFNYGSKISGNSALVEDCIQDLFIDLWQSRANISSTTSIKFYLFKALRNRIYRHHGDPSDLESIENSPAIGTEPCYEEQIIQMEIESLQMKELRKHVDELPSRQREAINLRYYHNFSNEEVARIMGISYQSACKFIYAALRKLVGSVKRSWQ
jgi:RNA polymerase sigma factor (sigma-70 family)